MEHGIEFYRNQEQALINQLNAVRAYIKAFFPEEVVSELAPIKPVTEKTLFSSSTFISQVQADLKQYQEARKRIAIPEKVLNALAKINEGKTSDVAAQMTTIYEDYKRDPQKAIKDARHYISKLKAEGKIEVIAEGKGSEGGTYRLVK